MSKTTINTLSLIIACALIITQHVGASAAQLLFSPDGGQGTGSIDTALPLAKLGSLSLPRGRMVVHGDTVQITMVPEWQFDPRVVLSGKVLDTRHTTQSGVSVIKGVALVTEGEWISHFDDKTSIESIDLASSNGAAGGTKTGRITGITATDIEITQLDGTKVSVPLSAIEQIHSPRAIEFSIPLLGISPALPLNQPVELNVTRVTANSMGRTFQLAQLKSVLRKQMDDGDMSTTKVVALGAFVSLINMGQLAPLLAIPLGQRTSLQRRAFFKQLPFNQQQ